MADQTNMQTEEKILTITPEAVTELKRLMTEEKEDTLYLRMGVAAGGCSGMSYAMAFDSNKTDQDKQYDYDGLPVIIDQRAMPYLKGTVLEYNGGLLGGGFNFANPNAKRTCGCGTSFTV